MRGARINSESRAGWRREIVAVLRLAAPVAGIQVAMMLMGTVDTMMLGRVSETALAAGALGNGISFGLVSFGMGLLMALDPIVAQAYGAGESRRVTRVLKRGLVMAVVLSLPLAFIMWNIRPILQALRQQPELITEATAYVRASIPGTLAFLLFVTIRQTLQAMSMVRPVFVAIVLANLFNVIANYALVFGHFGFPALGVLGSGLATSLARWGLLLATVVFASRHLRPFWRLPEPFSFRPRSYFRLLRLGVPVAFQISLEMWLFVAVAIIMGQIGARQLAGHQIAMSLSSLSFMVPLGIAGAAATRVGNAVGRGSMPDARRAALVCLVLGGAVMTISAVLFTVAPTSLARLFTPDRQVIEMAALLLPIAALFQIFDGLQVVGAGVLRGAADTRIPAIIALLGYWALGLPIAVLLAFRFAQGPQGLWRGLTLALASVAVLLLIRIRIRFSGHIEALEPDDS